MLQCDLHDMAQDGLLQPLIQRLRDGADPNSMVCMRSHCTFGAPILHVLSAMVCHMVTKTLHANTGICGLLALQAHLNMQLGLPRSQHCVRLCIFLTHIRHAVNTSKPHCMHVIAAVMFQKNRWRSLLEFRSGQPADKLCKHSML